LIKSVLPRDLFLSFSLFMMPILYLITVK